MSIKERFSHLLKLTFIAMELEQRYDNTSVRRQDRLLGFSRAYELLRGGEYGFLALGGESGYGVPINFVLCGDSIYFHCAPEGEKLRRIARNDRACFCVVGYTAPQPDKFTTEYESVLAFGRIFRVADDTERMRALEFLIDKYSPEFKTTGLKYAEKSFHRTAILRLDIERMSGKRKVVG